MSSNLHIPVLAKEVLESLNINPAGVYLDGTAGMGGHSQLIANKLTTGKLICLDQDQFAIDQLQKKFKNNDKVIIVKNNFSNIKDILNQLKLSGVDGVLLDLGVSSPMFDVPERGFSYKHEGQLDMRMDQSQELNAFRVVNFYPEKDLKDIFAKYGESFEANKVAHAIITARKSKLINTTNELVEIIKDSVSTKTLHLKKHPARIYFQALRMEVNNELNVLKKCLNDLQTILNVKGRMAIITYHSLEDRLVKETFYHYTHSSLPIEIPLNESIDFQLVNKKPITPSSNEINDNNRSRSAKLRVIERVK